MNLDLTVRRLGVCYYPEQWPRELWRRDATRMREAGITLVRIAEFAWGVFEPRPGELHFDWLDEAIETLAAEELAIVFGTPTATPPRWMLERHPDMLAVGADGRSRGFGSRRHYDFSHRGYREEAVRIVTILAGRYGKHPAIVAWQTDNEYGCHATTLSYSPAARAGFRRWLQDKYGSVDALNEAWGNVFWSMAYGSFEVVELPHLTVTEPNPAHVMDFRRYSSDQVVAFNRAQVEVIRAHAPGRPILHNYIGGETGFDHFAVGADLDIATWDSYPLGFLQDRTDATEEWKARFARQGDPDFQAFHHDLYRAVGRGRWWVMEQQPGPVNWAPVNPMPLPGMVRFWLWEAFAHGAEVVSVFRWRQAPFAQEAMHAGLLRPDHTPARGLQEVRRVADELSRLPSVGQHRSPVALAFDYRSAWAWAAQPQGEGLRYAALVFDAYRALRRLGLTVDIVDPDAADFSQYRLILAPGLIQLGERARQNLTGVPGLVLMGPRTGAKTADFRIPVPLPPALGEDFDARVTEVESLRPANRVDALGGAFVGWREIVEVGPRATALGEAADGIPVTVRQGRLIYLAGWPDTLLWRDVLTPLCAEAGLATTPVPDDVRVRDCGPYRFVFNHGLGAVDPRDFADGELLIGEPTLAPAGLAIVRSR